MIKECEEIPPHSVRGTLDLRVAKMKYETTLSHKDDQR